MTEKKETAKSEKKSDKYAVIATGGKQYLVEEGQVVKIEKLPAEEVSEKGVISFDQVLMQIDGDKVSIGTPIISKAKVSAKLVEEGRAKKISVIRYKSKSRYFKKKGHRQPYMKVEITKV